MSCVLISVFCFVLAIEDLTLYKTEDPHVFVTKTMLACNSGIRATICPVCSPLSYPFTPSFVILDSCPWPTVIVEWPFYPAFCVSVVLVIFSVSAFHCGCKSSKIINCQKFMVPWPYCFGLVVVRTLFCKCVVQEACSVFSHGSGR